MLIKHCTNFPITFVARHKAWIYGRSRSVITGSNPAGGSISFYCGCCVLSGGGVYVGLITRPEESNRLWYVWVWSWSTYNEKTLTHWVGCPATKKNIHLINITRYERTLLNSCPFASYTAWQYTEFSSQQAPSEFINFTYLDAPDFKTSPV